MLSRTVEDNTALEELCSGQCSLPGSLSGADQAKAAAVRGGSTHPQHLPHVGGCHELLPAHQQRHTRHLQDQHAPGIHRLQSQPDG